MKTHNIMEDIVRAATERVCRDIAENPSHHELCICAQCRLDAMCYVLNRVTPHYVVSSRGLERAAMYSFEKKQNGADLIALIFDAFRTVTHNRRPNHGCVMETEAARKDAPIFNVPAIIGKLLNGTNFAPVAGTNVSLYLGSDLIGMNNGNWQNPCFLSDKTEGNFTFWPQGIPAEKAGEEQVFEFSLRAEAEGFEPLHHAFEMPLKSEAAPSETFLMDAAFRLPSLYLFSL